MINLETPPFLAFIFTDIYPFLGPAILLVFTRHILMHTLVPWRYNSAQEIQPHRWQ